MSQGVSLVSRACVGKRPIAWGERAGCAIVVLVKYCACGCNSLARMRAVSLFCAQPPAVLVVFGSRDESPFLQDPTHTFNTIIAIPKPLLAPNQPQQSNSKTAICSLSPLLSPTASLLCAAPCASTTSGCLGGRSASLSAPQHSLLFLLCLCLGSRLRSTVVSCAGASAITNTLS